MQQRAALNQGQQQVQATAKHSHNRWSGFTLIELMIVVAIIGILAAIAWPSYQDQVRQGRRGDGQALLMEILQAQERFYIDRATYTDNLTQLGYAAQQTSENGFYIVTAGACPGGAVIAACVRLTATAQGAQVADGNLILDSNGTRTGNWN
ncbi:type IV pilin protein [Kistimonas scapharcae]